MPNPCAMHGHWRHGDGIKDGHPACGHVAWCTSCPNVSVARVVSCEHPIHRSNTCCHPCLAQHTLSTGAAYPEHDAAVKQIK